MTRRWTVVTLLTAATVISYLDRQALSVTAPTVRDDLDLSNFDYARIVFSFLLGYTLAQAPIGWLIDRLGPRRGFAAIIGWWSAVACLHAFANSVASFSVLRFLLAIGQAGSWAACVRTVAEWFPRRERGFPNGIWGAGTSLGTIVAVPLVAWLTVTVGWRAAFLITGLTGFVWLALWLLLYRSPETPETAATDGDAGPSLARAGSVSYRDLLRERNLWALILARVFADPVAWFYNAWVPEYLARTAGFSMGDIGRYAWIPFVVGGGGIVAGGLASDVLCRQGWSVIPSRMAVMLAGVLVMTIGAICAFPLPVVTAITVISIAVFGWGLWAPTGMCAGVGGMIYTLLTGWVLDAFGYGPVFVMSAISPLIAFCLLYGLFDREMALESGTGVGTFRVHDPP
jgi:MFS transporter, ACS family, hexuronate transporter